MSKRKPKLPMKKYEVTIIREIEHHAVVEVEAESEDVAQQMAVNIADHPHPHNRHWQEQSVLSQSFKTKVMP